MLKDEIKNYLQQELKGTPNFLVEVKLSEGDKKAVIYVDGDEGIAIDECASISRKVSTHLEEKDIIPESFILEVSSPGLSRPLQLKRQYKKNVGKNLKVINLEDKEFEGKLVYVDEEKIVLLQVDKKDEKHHEIFFSQIKEAKILL